MVKRTKPKATASPGGDAVAASVKPERTGIEYAPGVIGKRSTA